jgi:hypothetical protein
VKAAVVFLSRAFHRMHLRIINVRIWADVLVMVGDVPGSILGPKVCRAVRYRSGHSCVMSTCLPFGVKLGWTSTRAPLDLWTRDED